MTSYSDEKYTIYQPDPNAPPPEQTPFGVDRLPAPSPEEAKIQEISLDKGIKERIAAAKTFGPSVRQQTQSEVLQIALLHGQLGNPFSVRRLPYSVMRDMCCDPMIAFGLYYIKTPLIRSDWYIQSPDAQLAAAVDEALRPVNSHILLKYCNSLGYGYQPIVKRFKLGSLTGTYRDPHSDDAEKDRPIWPSNNVDALLWDTPIGPAPEHCIPRWDDSGKFAGFTFVQVPLPNPILAGTAYIYGRDLPGQYIPPEYAVWVVNEQIEEFGSIYGSPRTKRAYRYYWSYWFRWALADRSYENKSDPPLVIYFPTDVDVAIDSDDPNMNSPTERNLRQVALDLGQQTRSGARLAVPGDFMIDEQGRQTTARKWDLKYLEGGENFKLLDETFTYLDTMKLRSLFIPEQAFLEAKRGSASRLVVGQLGEVYQESQQIIADLYDEYQNKYWIPQFVAANFPEKVGTPCRKVSRGFGQQDAELVKQIIQLYGQVKGNVLPVDIYELLRQQGIPLQTENQYKQMLEQIAKEAAAQAPPEVPPQQQGMQGYNAGVTKTPLGMQYFTGPRRIELSETEDFVSSLPQHTPHFQDAGIKSAAVRMRRIFLKRYRELLDAWVKHISDKSVLKLAQSSSSPPPPTTTPPATSSIQPARTGLPAANAVMVAGTVMATFTPAVAGVALADTMAKILQQIAEAAGKRELLAAHLDLSAIPRDQIARWASTQADQSLESIDNTIRANLQDYLRSELEHGTDSEEIAQSVADHFANMPFTYSDRVARTETVAAYNYGMLSAIREAGVSQVQAHDASNGADRQTDSHCIERHGKVFSVVSALAEHTHPNDTLYWTPLLTENFRVERVTTLPAHLDQDGLAALDLDRETLYVSEEASAEQEKSYALAVGARLMLK